MQIIYKIGIVIGIIVIYLIVTLMCGYPVRKDDTLSWITAYVAGMVCFVVLFIFTMEKFGLWTL